MLAPVVLVPLAVLEFAVALLSFLLLCHLPGVALVVMAMLACCDNLLVMWPLVSWPMLVLLMPLVCLLLLFGGSCGPPLGADVTATSSLSVCVSVVVVVVVVVVGLLGGWKTIVFVVVVAMLVVPLLFLFC